MIKLPFKIFFLSVLFSTTLWSQSRLAFIENKGQWQKNILFNARLANGQIGLKPDGGYKMLLQHADDVKAISDLLHPLHTQPAERDHDCKGIHCTHSAHKNINITQNANAEVKVRNHVYETFFLNANPNPTVLRTKPENYYHNYIIGDKPQDWFGHCKLYNNVTYKNIYNNIDISYYTENGVLKYDFIVNPGGNINDIIVKFDGVDDLKVRNKKLCIKTSVHEVIEDEPYSYQPSNEGRKTINCGFKVKGNLVAFNIKDYDKNLPLVIDPKVIFSTFSGSYADNWGFTATYDDLGNFYAAGIVIGAEKFPVSDGAFQTVFKSGPIATYERAGFDIGILKFNPIGTDVLYVTYLGGAKGNEQPHSMVVDKQGNLSISGRTNSEDFPKTMLVQGSGGGWDIFITKLNAKGTGLVGSCVIGGSGDDGVNIIPKGTKTDLTNTMNRNYGDDARSEIICDDAGNLYVAGCTQSTDFFTKNAFQSTNASANNVERKQDGVFIKTNANVSNIITSSYLGGSNDDAAFVLSIHPFTKNIYIAGGTCSSDFPGNMSTAKFNSFQGDVCDGFVSILNNDGNQLLQSSYWGTSRVDLIYGIQIDRFGYPYIMGTTTGSWQVTGNVQFSQTNGRQFISKLKPDLSDYVFSTKFGTNNPAPNISPTAFLVDRCENMYVSGWGGSSNKLMNYLTAGTLGLTVTPDAPNSTTDGNDFYFAVIKRNAESLLHATFYGENIVNSFGDHVDGGTSRFDPQGIIYQAVCANCQDGNFPTTSGSYSPINNAAKAGRGCNLAALKVAFNFAGVATKIQTSIKGVVGDTTACVPAIVDFKELRRQGKTYQWDFGDGTPVQSSTVNTISHTYNTVGKYTVKVVSINDTACNYADSSYINVYISDEVAQLNLEAKKIGGCTSFQYQFTNTSTSLKNKLFAANAFNIDFGDGSPVQPFINKTISHTFPNEGTYKVKLLFNDANFCNNEDTFSVNIQLVSNIKAAFATPANGCVPYKPPIQNTSKGGLQYYWYDGQGNRQNATTPNFTYNTAGTYTIKLVAVDSNICNIADSVQYSIVVNNRPTSAFSFSPNPPEENKPIDFSNNSSADAVKFKWLFGDGDSLVTTNRAAISYAYGLTQTYTACLLTTNQYGCVDTACQPINAKGKPLFAVPNAFTPNGDGVNDVVYVKGFGVTKFDWKIYNRWGNLVFASNDIKQGWNGYYNGVLQPQEVYQYTLSIEMADGTKHQKTGDITLIK